MENHISAQLVMFGQSILLGLAVGLLYDLLRPVRLRVPWLAGFLDSLYCLAAAAAVFLFTIRQAEGQLRLYVLLGILGGGALFFGLFSAPLRPVWDFWADAAGDLLRLLAIPGRGLLAVCKKMWKAEKNLFYFCKKYYTIESTRQERIRFFTKEAECMAGEKGSARKKKRARAGFFTKLLILVLLAALGCQLVRIHGQVKSAQGERAQLTAQVSEKQQENDTLSQGIENGGSQEQMEEIARDQLGLVSPGEKVFYDVSN